MSHFYEKLEQFGGRTALSDERGQSLTYEELAAYTGKLGEKLRSRSLAFCFCENSLGCPAGYVTFLQRGVVPLMVARDIDAGLLASLREVYRPRYYYVPESKEERFAGLTVLARGYGYAMMEDESAPEAELYPELALLLTTSGSTGSSKLVRQSYTNLQTNAEQIAEYLKIDENERPITTLPLYYCYGLSIINSHLLKGAHILLTEQPMMIKAFWNYMKETRATSFAGVPFTYELLKKLRFFRMDLPDLRYMTQAGGKLSPELHREFAQWAREKGKDFIVMYGATEATSRMGYLPAEKSLEKYGSIGIPIPGGTYRILDLEGNEITEPGIEGELVYEGANVTLGYAQGREDLALGDERGGRLATGDIAKRDEEGYYYIVGRKSRFLKVFGNRVNLDETDRLVKRAYPEMDCVSTGHDDHVIVYITDEAKTDEVRRYLSATTRLSETAFSVRYIPEIPKNESGKVLYARLAAE